MGGGDGGDKLFICEKNSKYQVLSKKFKACLCLSGSITDTYIYTHAKPAADTNINLKH